MAENMKEKAKTESVFVAARQDAEKKMREMRLVEQKEDADKRIAAQCEKYIITADKYGYDHFLTEMLATMLEVLMPLQELSDQLVTMSEMMNCLESTLGLIDLSINDIGNVFNEGSKYGGVERLKSRWHIRVFKGNVVRRMKKINQYVKGMQGISASLSKALKGLSRKTSKKFTKGGAPRVVGATGERLTGRALEMVNARRKELGASAPDPVIHEGADTDPKNAPSVDDILPR